MHRIDAGTNAGPPQHISRSDDLRENPTGNDQCDIMSSPQYARASEHKGFVYWTVGAFVLVETEEASPKSLRDGFGGLSHFQQAGRRYTRYIGQRPHDSQVFSGMV